MPWLWARIMARCFNVTVSTFAAVFTGATLGMLGSIVCMWGPLLRCAPKESGKCIELLADLFSSRSLDAGTWLSRIQLLPTNKAVLIVSGRRRLAGLHPFFCR